MDKKFFLWFFTLKLSTFFVLLLIPLYIAGQENWECQSYPDEAGFKSRMEPMLGRIAADEFGRKCMARSKCPDTGLPVYTWALEGEKIYSPYTGRAYHQGPTGYFGPKARNTQGEITAFGGDPLKRDLPPAMANLLLDSTAVKPKAFLSIPGCLRQQYHFACKNWARFYPMLAVTMGEEWQRQFREAVANYVEIRRYSGDGSGKQYLTYPHSLVGQPGALLGGNSIDGGTENHKTMWRTSCLVYAQLFPEGAWISDYPRKEAFANTRESIRQYLKRLLYVGNGEYDSQIYYPHSIEGFLNLYDFSTDEESKLLAKFALDYYFATYALKNVDGYIAGGQKRGYLPKQKPGEMETLQWAFADNTTLNMEEAKASIHQVTTTYRPNRIISNLMQQNIAMPFEARMSRPFYHMDRYNAFQESYYRSHSFGLGNVYMSIVDNPNQQMVWSLVVEAPGGPLGFTGGQPYALTTSGHSPYTQTVHHKGTLLLISANSDLSHIPTKAFNIHTSRVNPWHLPDSAQVEQFELANRLRYASQPLQPIKRPARNDVAAIQELWDKKKYSAASWLLIPKGVDHIVVRPQKIIVEINEVLLGILPLQPDFFFIELETDSLSAIPNARWRKILQEYEVLIVPGSVSGYVIDVAEKSAFSSMEDFERVLNERTNLNTTNLESHKQLAYRCIDGTEVTMAYRAGGLKADASINGRRLDFENWNNGAVYDSPFLKIQNGVMEVSDGQNGYLVDFRTTLPIYKDADSR